MRTPPAIHLIASVLTALAITAGASADESGPEGFEALVGHGGPIQAVAVATAPSIAITASFDNALGVWDLKTGERLRWLEGHRAAVSGVAVTPDGRYAASGSDDHDAILWDVETGAALARLTGHQNKVQSVALSPDGAIVASASWDGDVGLWAVPSGERLALLDGHQSGVNDVAFSADGSELFSASSDGTVRRWRVATGAFIRVEVEHGFGINRLAVDDAAGWLAYGATDGVVRILDLATGAERAALTGDRRPILALVESPDGRVLAFGDGEGYITVAATEDWSIERDFRAAVRGPIWALAFADAERVVAGGLDDSAAIWAVADVRDPLFGDDAPRRFHVDPEEVSNGERQFARKCSVCHTLTPDGRRRAGPTLYGVFGRPAGSLADYEYSPALVAMRETLVWSPETLDKLFDVGPDIFTPGSKMPTQRIVDPADRADLIAFIQEATRPQ